MGVSSRLERLERRVEELETRKPGEFHVVQSEELGVNLTDEEVERRCAAIRAEHGDDALIIIVTYEDEALDSEVRREQERHG